MSSKIEAVESVKKSEVVISFDIPKSSLSTILKNKDSSEKCMVLVRLLPPGNGYALVLTKKWRRHSLSGSNRQGA